MCSLYCHLDRHAYCACTALLAIAIIRSEKIFNTGMHMCIVIDININQLHLLGSHRICVSMAKDTWYYIVACALVHTCAGMMEHSFTINSVI